MSAAVRAMPAVVMGFADWGMALILIVDDYLGGGRATR